ncbi:MAG: hypothetical protein H6978_05340 [Gammaproteobacteria bacterium]|nr:hypothetical protein [Gammaproteobacteria bacterium]
MLGIAMMSAAQAAEYFDSADTVAQWCRLAEQGAADAADKHAAGEACLAFIAGVHDTNTLLVTAAGMNPTYCAPADATLGQLARVFSGYMARNEEDGNLPAAAAVMLALQESYPCPSAAVP